MERRLYVETYGCQMNVADSELMLGQLGRAGYRRVEKPEDADVILVNTCAIREHAEQRIYGRLGELTRHKVRRPGVILGVAGCMAQHLRNRLIERVPQVDLVVGPDGYRCLPELIDEARDEPTLSVRLSRVETYGDLSPARADGVRAWVRHHARVRQVLRVLHRAVRAGPGAEPPRRRGDASGGARRRGGLPRDRVPGSDRERLPRPGSGRGFRGAAPARETAWRASRESDSRRPIPRT